MNTKPLRILLADDDEDDCLFFSEALSESSIATHLTTVHDGEQLMQWLRANTGQLPDALFLDLNMPRKTGFDCLADIKLDRSLMLIPIIILSTSFDPDIATFLYQNGAYYCIRKPVDFSKLKNLIHQAISLIAQKTTVHPTRENFILAG